jgi:Ca2+-binding EF-hand superfamily protein
LQEFVIGLSAITRGSIEDKLDWIFSLYDVKNRGYITEAEVSLVTESIYALLSKHMHGQAPKEAILRHSREVFQVGSNYNLFKVYLFRN